MVDVLDRVGLPTRISDLLLTFAGRVDDDALIEAREFLAVAELGRAVELLLGTIAAGPVPVTAGERDELARLADRLLLDDRMLDRLALTDRVNVHHRFTSGSVGDPAPEEGVLQALSTVLRVLPDVRGLWCVWRTTPAGAVPGPVPQRVVLIEVGPGGFAPSTAYRSENALRAAGISAVVEVLRSGGMVPSYHDEALAAARAIPLGNTLPARGSEPSSRVLGSSRVTDDGGRQAAAGVSSTQQAGGGQSWNSERQPQARGTAESGSSELNSRYGPEPSYSQASEQPAFSATAQVARPPAQPAAQPAAVPTPPAEPQASQATQADKGAESATADADTNEAQPTDGESGAASQQTTGISTVTELRTGANPVVEQAKPHAPAGFAPPVEDGPQDSSETVQSGQDTSNVVADTGFTPAPSSAEPTQRQEAPGASTTSTSSGWRVARPEPETPSASTDTAAEGTSTTSASSAASTPAVGSTAPSAPSAPAQDSSATYQPTIPDDAGLNQRELGLLRQLHEELSRREQADREKAGGESTGAQSGSQGGGAHGGTRPSELPASGATSWMPAPDQRSPFNNINGSQRPGSTH